MHSIVFRIGVASREEVYYPPFEGAVEAGVGSMMCASLRAVAALFVSLTDLQASLERQLQQDQRVLELREPEHVAERSQTGHQL